MKRTNARTFAPPPALLLLVCLAVACLTPACSWLPLVNPQPLDKGGTYFVIAVRADAAELPRRVGQTMQVIEARCDALGVFCNLRRRGGEGSDLFELRVSTPLDMGRVKGVLLATGKLELRPVVSPLNPAPIQIYSTREEATAAAGAEHDVMPYVADDEQNAFVVVERTPVVTGEDMRSAGAEESPVGAADYQIYFTLKPEGAVRLGDWTEANTNRYLAIVLNGRVRSAPYVKGRITDSGQITGSFTKEQAEDTALVLRSGSLSAPLEVLEEGAYKP